jgi:class 3 adenylate cyclase
MSFTVPTMQRVESFSIRGGNPPGAVGGPSLTEFPDAVVAEKPLPPWSRHASAAHLLNPQRSFMKQHGRPPLNDQATIVFVDVQSSAHLWETMPDVMRSQVPLYREVLRAKRVAHEGYLVDSLGDRFVFAFGGPLSACRFALDVQLALCAAEWSAELCENPDTPTELVRGSTSLYLWRGLRAAIGIQHGANPSVDLSSGATFYSGEAVEVASLLQLIAVGGEILIPGEVQGAVFNYINSSTAIIEPVGRLSMHRCKATVYRVVHAQHQARLHYLQRDLATAEEGGVDGLKDVRSCIASHYITAAPTLFHAPPRGTVAAVSIALAHLKEIRENPQLKEKDVETVLHLYRKAVEAVARNNRGHMSRFFDCHYDVVFQQPYDAVNFALKLHQQLVDTQWSDDIMMMPQCANVRVQSHTIFNGPRIRAGVHLYEGAFPETDGLTGAGVYDAHREGKNAAALCSMALPGETLITGPVVDLVMKNIDRLKYPVCEPAMASTLPSGDAMATLHQLFPAALAQRAAFLKRSMQLAGEPGDDRTEAIEVATRNLTTLQQKLEDKDRLIATLERQTEEKTQVIASMRRNIEGRGFREVNVRDELLRIEGAAFHTDACYLLALSFAHVAPLLEQWPDEFPLAVNVFDEFATTLLASFGGIEIRRANSGTVRILTFNDVHSAVDYWLSVVRNVQHLPWPERLLQSEHAGAVMASDLKPGLHPSLDTMVWKGLRPIAALVVGVPDSALNPCTRTMVAAGGIVNDVVLVMRRAEEGELLMPEDLGQDAAVVCEDRVTNGVFEQLPALRATRVYPAELVYRHLDAGRRMAALGADVANQPLIPRHDTRRAAALIVHVVMQKSSLFEGTNIFSNDIDTFHLVMKNLLEEHKGVLITATRTEYLIGFTDIADGSDFAVRIHYALLRAPWSLPLLRLPECRLRYGDQGLMMGGIMASVGCHAVHDASLQLDLVDGTDVWVHKELAVPYLMTRDAEPGQTISTLAALPHLQAVKRFAVFHEVIGSVVMPTDNVPGLIYAVLPSALRGRVVAFAEDAKERQLSATAEDYQKAQLRVTKRRMEHAEGMVRDRNAIGAIPAVESGVQEAVHEINHRAMKLARTQFVKMVRAQVTAEDTLAVLETVSMMAEDPLYFSDEHKQKNTTPQHQGLLFHHLETAGVCRRSIFDRQQANQLIVKATMGEDFQYDEEPAFGVGDRSASFRGLGTRESANNRSMRRTKSFANPDASVASMPSRRGSARDLSAGTIPAEDAVRLHVDVERFANLILMFGIAQGAGEQGNEELLRSWIEPVYENVCPDGIHPNTAIESRLRDLARQTRSLDITEDVKHGIDAEELYRSVVANLSLALQRLCLEAGSPAAQSFRIAKK